MTLNLFFTPLTAIHHFNNNIFHPLQLLKKFVVNINITVLLSSSKALWERSIPKSVGKNNRAKVEESHSKKHRSTWLHKGHGWDFDYEIISPASRVKISNLLFECEQNLKALLNSSSFKCHTPLLSFILSSNYLQHGSFIWGGVGADVVNNRQREVNILPTHKTISYRFIWPYAHELSPDPLLPLQHPGVSVFKWDLLIMARAWPA